MRNSGPLLAAIAAAVSMALSASAYPQTSQQSPSSQSSPGGDKATRGEAKSSTSARKEEAKVDSGDRRLMTRAAQMGVAEVATSKVAMEKASRPEVKKFAEHMVKEHEKSNSELKQIASSKGVSLPTLPDGKHQDALKNLRGMSGEKFDRQYMEQAGVKDHKATLDLFQDGAKKAKDPELKAFFEKNVTDIKQHLAMAQDIAGQDGGEATKKGGGDSTSGKKQSDRGGSASKSSDRQGGAGSGSK
jgi:putative membrane protein